MVSAYTVCTILVMRITSPCLSIVSLHTAYCPPCQCSNLPVTHAILSEPRQLMIRGLAWVLFCQDRGLISGGAARILIILCACRYALRAPQKKHIEFKARGRGEMLIECEILTAHQATLVRTSQWIYNLHCATAIAVSSFLPHPKTGDQC